MSTHRFHDLKGSVPRAAGPTAVAGNHRRSSIVRAHGTPRVTRRRPHETDTDPIPDVGFRGIMHG
jgi:hypothetical protein